METTQFIYKDKEFIPRAKKTFKPYQIKGIWLQKRYDEFERNFVGEDVQKNINKNLFQDKDFLNKVASLGKDFEEIGKTFLQNESGFELINYLQLKTQAKELFLLDEANTRELMEIMFENHADMNHETNTDEEATEYEQFMLTVLSAFFLKFKKQIGI